MRTEVVSIPMAEGVCDGYFVSFDHEGLAPAVLFYMDVVGLRPSLLAMAERIASSGYAVLLPNLLWRYGAAPVAPPEELVKPENRERLFTLIASLTPERMESDACDYVAWLDGRGAIPSRLGVIGYCMSGAAALRTAAMFPERVAAAAVYHGSMLASEAADSPHHLLGRIGAELYFGLAEHDPVMPPDQVVRLRTALERSGLTYEMETYPNTGHGFAVHPAAGNAAAVARHWETMLDLFKRRLHPGC